MRLTGARIAGIDEFENGILVLNRKTLLGSRGERIITPIDTTIFTYVIQHGEWESYEARFLADVLSRCKDNHEVGSQIYFLDIGANAGLITRQVLNLARFELNALLIEPIPNYVKAIEANMKKFENFHNVHILESGLDKFTGEKKIRIQVSNKGNASFLASPIPKSESSEKIVKVLAVKEFSQKYLKDCDGIVIKSDTQGFDATVLSLLPNRIWNRCSGIVVEIWALPEIDSEEVAKLMQQWQRFSFLGWDDEGKNRTNLEDIRNFWLSKSGKSRNLYGKI